MAEVGVWSHRHVLEQLGRAGFERAVRSGQLTKIAYGWYATITADPDVVTATRLGGQLGCVSVAKRSGLWVPPSSGLHVCVPRLERPSRTDDVTLHRVRRRAGESAVVTVDVALDQIVAFHDFETAACIIESAVANRALTLHEARALIAVRHGRAWAQKWIHEGAGSGNETKLRLWLQRHRYQFRTQVAIPHVGFVDFLVGRSLVIEVDSREFHTGVENYQRDRTRDLVLADGGFRCIRLTAEQVQFQWPTTTQTLRRILATGQHLQPPRPR